MSVQKGEGKKRASDCVTRCCRHAPAVLAFTKEKTRIVPRGSMVHWNFNEIFAFAIGWSEKGIDSERENRPFCSLPKRFRELRFHPLVYIPRWTIAWKIGAPNGRMFVLFLSTRFSRMQITSVYYFTNGVFDASERASEREREREKLQSIREIMKRCFDCSAGVCM